MLGKLAGGKIKYEYPLLHTKKISDNEERSEDSSLLGHYAVPPSE